MHVLEHSYVSMTGATLLLILAIAFVPPKVSRKKRVVIGILHVSSHLAAALILMLLLELGIETCIRHKLLATSGKLRFLFLWWMVQIFLFNIAGTFSFCSSNSYFFRWSLSKRC